VVAAGGSAYMVQLLLDRCLHRSTA
jgi:hypothetical protein